MPTTYSSSYELQGNRLDPLYPHDAAAQAVAIKPAGAGTTTLQAGTILGEVTATPGTYGAYASGNSDGTQNPNAILKYTITVDTSGNITGLNEWGQAVTSVEAYYMGTFRTQDLVGLDSNAVTKLNARLIEGSVTQGIVHIG